MCQPKSQGGKRCQAHLSGSLAAVSQAAVTARVPEDTARSVFSDLRREGKGMADPTKEEVQAFADEMRVRALFDQTIPSTVRNTLIRRWGRALRDALPTGATFHAWKNVFSETIRRNRSRFAAIAIAGAIGFTAACSGGGGSPTDPVTPPSPSSSVSAPSSSGSPTSGPTNTAPGTGLTDIGLNDKGYGGLRKVEVPGGSYEQISVLPNNPIMQYNDAVVDQAVKDKYTQEQIVAAQQTIEKFVVEEAVDSILTDNGGDEATQQKWFAANKDKFSADNQQNVQDSLKKDYTNGLVNSYGSDARKYKLMANGQSRTEDLDVKVTRVYLNDLGQISVDTSVLVQRRGDVDKSTGKTGLETMRGSVRYAVTEENGTWKITGWNSNWDVISLANQMPGETLLNTEK